MSLVYVSNADSATISVLRLDDDAVTPIQTVTVGGMVMPLAVTPDRRHLYAALRSAPYSVACFEISSGTGELHELATVPLPDSMAFLGTDRSGRYLLAASYGGDILAVHRIGAEGVVDPDPVEVHPTAPHPHSMVPDPSNRYLFAPVLGGDTILQFRFDPATGRSTPNGSVATKPGAGPRHLVFHPGGRFAYVSNELDGTVGCFEFDSSTGQLTALDTYSTVPEGYSNPWTSELRCTPDGRHLYVADRRSSTLTSFEVHAATGALRPLGHTPTETCPRGFDIDPSGRYLLAAGQQSNSLTVYAIDPDTAGLTPLSRHPLGRNPNWVTIIDSSVSADGIEPPTVGV